MNETYEEIVKKWYLKLRDNFTEVLLDKYKKTNIRRADAENIYQDVFIAIQENLVQGRIRENTSWSSYIMTVGLNMASKHYRKIGKIDSTDEANDSNDNDANFKTAKKVEDLLKTLPDEDTDLYNDPEVQEVLSDELTHTPEPCASIIRLTYYGGLSDAKITEILDNYNSAKAVKAKRWHCMRDLVYRVKMALYNAGIIDDKPAKKARNESNVQSSGEVLVKDFVNNAYEDDFFEDVFFDKLSQAEKLSFEEKLKSDKSFATDFRIFLITVKGIYKEAEAENVEFGYALKHISKTQLLSVIGRENRRRAWTGTILFERLAWAASIVVILTVGITLIFNVKRSAQYALDDTLVAYNYIPTSSRDGSESIDITTLSKTQLEEYLPELQQAYASVSPDDIQEGEFAGMQLAMAYLKLHDRKEAKALLKDLANRYADDEAFVAQCNLILKQLE